MLASIMCAMSNPIDDNVDDVDHGALVMDFLEHFWLANGLTRRAWCRAAGLPDSSVGRWRDGVEPEIASLKKVARGVQRPLVDLLLIAGYLSPEELAGPTPPEIQTFNVERAIRLDPGITEAEREALMAIHRAISAVESGSSRSVRIGRRVSAK